MSHVNICFLISLKAPLLKIEFHKILRAQQGPNRWVGAQLISENLLRLFLKCGLLAFLISLSACAPQPNTPPTPPVYRGYAPPQGEIIVPTNTVPAAPPVVVGAPPGAIVRAPVGAASSSPVGVVNLQSLPQTIGLEHQDRVNRFNRLANLNGIQPPQIDQLQLSSGMVPGVNYPVPVVRVLFDEKVFFDFDKDVVRPEAEKVLDVIAQNMKKDVPDANLLVLGHTDAIGTDAYNLGLSKRRAITVLSGLISRGVKPVQLATVAIGKHQPIAPNNTDEGRARNRRVEFMISANQLANLQLVEHRRINQDYLTVKPDEPPQLTPAAPAKVDVLLPQDLGVVGKPAAQIGSNVNPALVKPAEPTPPVQLAEKLPAQIQLRAPSVVAPYEVNKPKPVGQAALNAEFQL